MRIRNGTSSMFIQDKKYVLDYLREREVKSKYYFDFIRRRKFGLLDNATFLIDGDLYEITHFLTKSQITGYDIKSVNRQLNLEGTDEVAIALVSGDDIICVDRQTNKVFLWKIQTGNGEKNVITKSLDAFFEILE